MENLKKQQEKLLTQEITRKIMEYMMGLNEKNEEKIKKKIKKTFRKVVQLYSATIDEQHKKAANAKKESNSSIAVANEQLDITGDEMIITTVPEEYVEALAS